MSYRVSKGVEWQISKLKNENLIKRTGPKLIVGGYNL